MTRHTPAELLEISKAEMRRKRVLMEERKRADKAARRVARKSARESSQMKLEQDTLWARILSAAMSSQDELKLENLTRAQLDFLAAKGIEHGAVYSRINSAARLRRKVDSLNEKFDLIEDKIKEIQDAREAGLIASSREINSWVNRNEQIAFQSSLELWFGEDFNVDWSFDRDAAAGLRDYLVSHLETSWQKKKVRGLKKLKKLIDVQLSIDDKYTQKIEKLESQLVLLRSNAKKIESDEDLQADESTDSVHWISWQNSERLKYWDGDPDIALLGWVTSCKGRASLKLVDSVLLRKASAGERKAILTIGESPPYQTAVEGTDSINHRYTCDDQLVCPSGPDAEQFCLLMQATGYKVRATKKQNGVWQVTVSW